MKKPKPLFDGDEKVKKHICQSSSRERRLTGLNLRSIALYLRN